MLYRECREMSIGDQVALNARRFHQLAQDLGVLVPRRRDPRRPRAVADTPPAIARDRAVPALRADLGQGHRSKLRRLPDAADRRAQRPRAACAARASSGRCRPSSPATFS